MNKIQMENLKRAFAYIHSTMRRHVLSVEEIDELAPLWKQTAPVVQKKLAKAAPNEEIQQEKDVDRSRFGRNFGKGRRLEGD